MAGQPRRDRPGPPRRAPDARPRMAPRARRQLGTVGSRSAGWFHERAVFKTFQELARRLVESVVEPAPLKAAVTEGIRRIEDIATGRIEGLTEVQYRAVLQ